MDLSSRTDNDTKFILPLILMGVIGAIVMFFNPNTSTEFALLFILSPTVIISYQLYIRANNSQTSIYAFPIFWLVVSILLIFLVAPFFLNSPQIIQWYHFRTGIGKIPMDLH